MKSLSVLRIMYNVYKVGRYVMGSRAYFASFVKTYCILFFPVDIVDRSHLNSFAVS